MNTKTQHTDIGTHREGGGVVLGLVVVSHYLMRNGTHAAEGGRYRDGRTGIELEWLLLCTMRPFKRTFERDTNCMDWKRLYGERDEETDRSKLWARRTRVGDGGSWGGGGVETLMGKIDIKSRVARRTEYNGINLRDYRS